MASRPGRTTIALSPVQVVAELTLDDGDLVATVGSAKLRLSDLDDPNGTVQLSVGSAEVGLRPMGLGKRARPAKASRRIATKEKSGKARWASAFVDGASLIEETAPNGVKGAIVLDNRPASDAKWQFELVLSTGLTPLIGNGEVPGLAELRLSSAPIRIVDAEGSVVAEIPIGAARDAKGNKGRVDIDLRRAKAGRWIVEVSADAEWLAAAGREYPVELDPTIVVPAPAGGLNATSIDGVIAGRHGYTSDVISDQWPGYATRNLLETFNLAGLGVGPNVTNATLNVHVGTCDAPYAWSPYAFSIGVSGVNDTVEYIRTQEEHHRQRSYREEVEAFLKKHGFDAGPGMME